MCEYAVIPTEITQIHKINNLLIKVILTDLNQLSYFHFQPNGKQLNKFQENQIYNLTFPLIIISDSDHYIVFSWSLYFFLLTEQYMNCSLRLIDEIK